MSETYTERVSRGAALLDRVAGPEWINFVNLDRLNIKSVHDCVLAQVFDDSFCVATDFIPVEDEDLWKFGFDSTFTLTTSAEADMEYFGLNVAWKSYIREALGG